MRKYREMLQAAQDNNVNIFNLNIAFETSQFFDKDGEDFDAICDLVRDIYLHTFHTCIETICNALQYAINNEHLDIYKRFNKEEWDELIELVCSFD